jgi:thiol-disulfide isomerase/thioredoxin
MDWSTSNARDISLRPGDEPPLGAHLVTPRTLYSHHGIYVGGGRVIHYSGLAYGLRRGPVEDVSLEHFARGRGIRVRREPARFDRREAVARARSRLGESRYRLLTNNCKHFCAWVLRGASAESRMKVSRLAMKAHLIWLALLSAICVGSASFAEDNRMLQQHMPSLGRANAWLNSHPLSAAELRGKVVLVDFWTYTCINWRRTLPYVRAWAEKYKDQGLVVVGVHTPEFSFEKDLDNVRRAAREQRVDYAIAVDSDYAIWRAFENEYWPALYLIDAQGRIRHHQFGEGDYDRAERMIQQLLVEAGHTDVDRALVSVEPSGAEAAADWRNLQSPETYVGRTLAQRFSSRDPQSLRANEWTLVGDWRRGNESAVLDQSNGKVAYRFHARDVHLIMGSTTREKPVRFRIRIDGQPPGDSHGLDTDAAGNGRMSEPRMYQLIRQTGPIDDRLFEIEFLDAGAEVFDFTFG